MTRISLIKLILARSVLVRYNFPSIFFTRIFFEVVLLGLSVYFIPLFRCFVLWHIYATATQP